MGDRHAGGVWLIGKPELLAPAGEWDALVAAVENGADAVYFGGKAFNARGYAKNFEKDELARAIDFAHVRGAKVYITVNTLIDDAEFEPALSHMGEIYAAGADAIIVQDLGLASAVRKIFPGLPLYASTQMTIHNAEGAHLLFDIGFARVILARELGLDEIREIGSKVGIELEVFVHGALCISYSGQCLMSSIIGGRSGNRGRCAQPCRLEYSLVDGAGTNLSEGVGPYLLSTRDLKMIDHIPDLVSAGVTSFKIEGRMRRPEYVGVVVQIYRNAIDRFIADPAGFRALPGEEQDLEQAFNRDFTTGYFFGNPGRDLMSYKRPNNRGTFLGRVVGVYGNRVDVRLEQNLQVGDGIEVWVSRGGRAGARIGTITVDGKAVESAAAGTTVALDVRGRITVGDRVFKTYDVGLMSRVQQSYKSPRAYRKVPVTIRAKVKAGCPFEVVLADNDGNVVQASSSFPAEEARMRPLDGGTVREHLLRLGNTPFEATQVEVEITGNVMVPLSVINAARREAINKLEEARAARSRRGPVSWGKSGEYGREPFASSMACTNVGNWNRPHLSVESPISGKVLLAVKVGDLESLSEAVASGADIVYLGSEGFNSKPGLSCAGIEKGIDRCHEAGVKLYLGFPRIIKNFEMKEAEGLVEGFLGKCDGYLIGNLGLLRLVRAEFPEVQVAADWPLNAYNSFCVNFLWQTGALRVTLSPELTLEQIRGIRRRTGAPLECLVHGPIPMMVSEYCVIGSVLKECPASCKGRTFGLKDRLGLTFQVEVDRSCRMHVFNPMDLCMVEHIPELVGARVNVLRIEASPRAKEYVRTVTRAYREAIEGSFDSVEARKLLEGVSPAGITKGHYFRGVT